MGALKTLFKQTFIYGLATVLPRMLSFLLVRLHTGEGVLNSVADYGDVSLIYTYFVLFNVILAYGMETAFFRFFYKEDDKDKVISTAALSLICSSLLCFALAWFFRASIGAVTNIQTEYIALVIWTLLLDALVIIPFAWLRANQSPIKYAAIKILNVCISLGLNVFLLLYLKGLSTTGGLFEMIYQPNYEVNYIFIANLVASAVTLLLLLPFYTKVSFRFDAALWKKMMAYAWPILVAGIAFSINETFDRILLERLLPKHIAKTEMGMYSACYKLALFMTLFATGYRLGIEPFFFSQAKAESPKKNYAKILEFFVVIGSLILLVVIVFADVLKIIFIGKDYWGAMWIVPVILLANFCLGIYHNLSVWYKITDRTKVGAYISVFGAMVTLVLNLLLIKHFSFKASAVATLSAYASMMLMSYFLGRKYYPIPYNIKKIGLYMSISIIFSIVSFYYFRANYYVGTSLILILLATIWYQENQQIKQLLKR
ncbi:MAG: oligosaccharide flippase family protein [Flavobacteriaceae bacterium]|nr:oligosaccharide flippase family protein [Flavobacteriaceae bacterium]